MKKTWIALGLAALIALPLAGCTGNSASNGKEDLPPPYTQPSASPSALPGTGEDLADGDGVVGDEGLDNAPGARMGYGYGSGTLEQDMMEQGRSGWGMGSGNGSALEDVGDSIAQGIDQMGDAARSAADRMGNMARRAGRNAKEALN